MLNSRASRILSFLFLLPLAGIAQMPRDIAPLKYWPAPLYWQASHEEIRTAAKPERFGSVTPTGEPAQTPANSLVFVAVTPCRLVDTRTGFGFTGAFGPPSLAAAATRSFPIQTSATCTLPASAQAYSLNVTVVPPGPLTYLTMWPMGATQPNASTLNDTLGGIVANAAVIPAGNDGSGSVDVFVSDSTNLVIDINGYYAAQSGITLTQGSAGAPSLSFASDSATGIFSSATSTVNIATGGINRLTIRPDGDIDVPGSVRKTGALFLHNLGTNNTALGLTALSSNTTGTANTATGRNALLSNTIGINNTASGSNALASNLNGGRNTATGESALLSNIDGFNNTADGQDALTANTSGSNNAAIGQDALASNTTGHENTALGGQTLTFSTTGLDNTAVGYGALFNNSTGSNNIAIGFQAVLGNSENSSNNIQIGSQGTSADNGVIRIGTPGTQSSFFVAGVRSVATSQSNAIPVLIDSNGQLGTVSSSIRFKEDVHDMAGASSGLLRLRPVTFRYKQPYADGSKPLDYGLIAEEVAEIYPDLVVKNSDGQIETVQYQKLTPMLLNELQKQAEVNRKLEERLAAIEALLKQLGTP